MKFLKQFGKSGLQTLVLRVLNGKNTNSIKVEPLPKNGVKKQVILRLLVRIGEIAQKEWNNTPYIRKNIGLHAFIIMPNHIHGIIEIKEKYRGKSVSSLSEEIGKFRSPSQTIGSIIRGYKIATIKKIKEKINNFSSTGELQFAPTKTKRLTIIFQIIS